MTDDAVGFGRPPKATQFQKGQSGNPKGRPKGKRNLATALLAAANERVTIVESGKRKNISKLEAAAKQLANKAASGDSRAIKLLCDLLQVHEGQLSPELSSSVDKDDGALMASLAKRFNRDLLAVEVSLQVDAEAKSAGPTPTEASR